MPNSEGQYLPGEVVETVIDHGRGRNWRRYLVTVVLDGGKYVRVHFHQNHWHDTSIPRAYINVSIEEAEEAYEAAGGKYIMPPRWSEWQGKYRED